MAEANPKAATSPARPTTAKNDIPDLEDDPAADRRLRRRHLATTIVTQIATSRGDARASAPRKAEKALLDVGGRLCDLSQAEWVCALEAGLLQQVLASIFDGGFCGSADSEVYQWKDAPLSHFYSMRYASAVLLLFSECCLHLHAVLITPKDEVEDWTEEDARTLESAAQMAMDSSPRFWQLIHKFRESLLSNMYESVTYLVDDMDNTCTRLAMFASCVLKLHEHFNLPFDYTHGVDQEVTLFLLWMRCVQSDHGDLAWWPLNPMLKLLWNRTNDTHLDVFCQRVAAEVTLSVLTQVFCKIYTTNSDDEGDLFGILWLHGSIVGSIQKNDCRIKALDYATISCVLAACRRYLCRGKTRYQDVEVISAMLFCMRGPMNQCLSGHRAYLKEWVVLALVVHLCAAFPDIILNPAKPGQEAPGAYFEEALKNCTRMFLDLKVSPRPLPSSPIFNVLRRYTLRCCEDLLEDARTHPIIGNRKWTSFVSRWRKLVEVLPRPTHEETEDEAWRVTSLKRCAWRKCACNVFKPAHRMRVCVGCYAVAYCGDKCREKDWIQGAHNTRCGRFRRSSV